LAIRLSISTQHQSVTVRQKDRQMDILHHHRARCVPHLT